MPGDRRASPRATPRPPAHRATPGRLAAAQALLGVFEGQALDDALARFAPREATDRAAAWDLAFGVLRHFASIDAALRVPLRRAPSSLEPPVQVALQLSAFEAMYTETPPHAIVDQAVEVVRALGAGRASGLVNAVSRRVRPLDRSLSRAERLEHPAWLVERWSARYGVEATDAWCAANAKQPPLCIVVREQPDLWKSRLEATGLQLTQGRAQGADVPGVWRLTGRVGRIEQLAGFAEGAWWVADAASVAVADLVPSSATTVLDACAAPGGKSLRLASRGLRVTSADSSERRLGLLREARLRTRLEGPVIQHDWLDGPCASLSTFDAVLVDAPCTGLGTVRRRPDIRWRRGPFDPAASGKRQLEIATHALAHVRPGGHLIYAVCSAEPEEGERVVAALCEREPRLSLETTFCSAPPTDDEDAFYAARLVRNA